MIRVDPRAGSKTLIEPLRKAGVKVEVEQMAYGDVAWLTHDCRSIGLEHKRLSDLMACIVDGRFADHQLPGLRACYDIVWLVVQDEYRCGKDGELLIRGKRGTGWRDIPWGRRVWMYSAIEHWLSTMRHEAGVLVKNTPDIAATVAWIRAEYQWHQIKEHGSLKTFHRGVPPATIVRPGITRRMAKEIPGVGWEVSGRVARQFGTPRRMVNATVDEWKAVEGVGPVIAKRAVWLMEHGKEEGSR